MPQKANTTHQSQDKTKEERMEYDLEKLLDLPEDERVEAFAWALGQLTEEELDELILRCADIIEAVNERQKGGTQYSA
jgi:hypothetical protein